jgi:hypothetical protein
MRALLLLLVNVVAICGCTSSRTVRCEQRLEPINQPGPKAVGPSISPKQPAAQPLEKGVEP